MLNIHRLTLLRELAHRKTVAAVAEAFFLSPSAVSQQLSVLEREAGVALIEKQGRGIKLTPAGIQLVRDSEAVFTALEHAEAQLIETSQGLNGSVELSAFPTGARSLVIPAVKTLHKRHPHLHIHVQDHEPEDSLPLLSTDALDLVVYYEWNVLPAIQAPGIVTRDLVSERVYLCMSPRHRLADRRGPIGLEELADENWIVGRESTSMLGFVSAATALAGYAPHTSFQSMDFEVILAAVEADLGIAFIPPLAFSHYNQAPDVAYKRVANLNLHRTIKAATRAGSESNPLIKTVLAELQGQAERIQKRLDKTSF